MNNRVPDRTGHFGEFGGRFVPETLIYALDELEKEYLEAKKNKEFAKEFSFLLREWPYRPAR